MLLPPLPLPSSTSLSSSLPPPPSSPHPSPPPPPIPSTDPGSIPLAHEHPIDPVPGSCAARCERGQEWVGAHSTILQPGTDRRVTCGINPSPHQSSLDPSSTVPWVSHISHVGCYKAPNATMSPRGSNDFDMIQARVPFLDFCNPLGIRVRLHIPNLRSLARGALTVKNRGRGSVSVRRPSVPLADTLKSYIGMSAGSWKKPLRGNYFIPGHTESMGTRC